MGPRVKGRLACAVDDETKRSGRIGITVIEKSDEGVCVCVRACDERPLNLSDELRIQEGSKRRVARDGREE
jgi:hypothetical protein